MNGCREKRRRCSYYLNVFMREKGRIMGIYWSADANAGSEIGVVTR